MKFRCERDTLVEALGAAGPGRRQPRRRTPVLAGVRAELVGNRLRLTGSDLELTIEWRSRWLVKPTGSRCCRPRSPLMSSVRWEIRVEVSIEGDEANITAGRFESSIRLLPADEFPAWPCRPTRAVTLVAKDFASALHQVVPAASADDARPILTGVLMAAEEGGLRLVATDSYRLAVRDLPGTSVMSEGQSVLVPLRIAPVNWNASSARPRITLRLGERAAFEVGGVRLTTRLIEGDFPNYRGLIPASHPNQLTVGRERLVEAVLREAHGP